MDTANSNDITAGYAAYVYSLQKKLSEMTMEDYCLFRSYNRIVNTVEDRDRQMASLENLIADIHSDDPDMQIETSNLFRDILLTGPNAPFQQVLQAGVLPRFIHFLEKDNLPQLQVVAADILTLYAESSEQLDIVFYQEAVPKLVNLIHAPHRLTCGEAILTLGVIAMKSPELRELVLHNQALEPLLSRFNKDDSVHIHPFVAQALYDFCNCDPPLSNDMFIQILPALQKLLYSNDQRLMVVACQTLQCLSLSRIGYAKADIKIAVCSKLVEMLDDRSSSVILAAMRIVANILTDGGRPLVQYIIDLGALHKLGKLLVSVYGNEIVMPACQIMTTITTKNCNHTQAVVSEGIIYLLAHVFESSEIMKLKHEAAMAISNFACNGTTEDVKSMSGHCIKPMCDILFCPDKALVLNCLKGLDRILHLWQPAINNALSIGFRYYASRIEQVNGLWNISWLKNHEHDMDSYISCLADCGQDLDSNIANHGQDLDSLIASLSNRGQDLDSNIPALSNRGQYLDSNTVALANRGQDLDSNIASLANRGQDLDSNIVALANRRQDLNSNIAALARRILFLYWPK